MPNPPTTSPNSPPPTAPACAAPPRSPWPRRNLPRRKAHTRPGAKARPPGGLRHRTRHRAGILRQRQPHHARTLPNHARRQARPRLHRHTNPSQEFTKLVRLHGIGLSGGRGLGKRRTWHSKAFHSLRAYIATGLASAGVSLAMAMHLIGHESEDAHAVYVRPTMAQLRTAAAKIAS